MTAACYQEPPFVPPSSLTLTIIACHGKALARGASATFNAAGGTIGRDADNTLVLPDDDGMVARRHAVVRSLADGWQLLNTSEQAALALNGKILAPGAQTSLQAGDIVNIGAYVLQTAAGASPLLQDSLPQGESAAEARTSGASLEASLKPSFGLPSSTAAGADPLPNPLRTKALPVGHPTDPLNDPGPSSTCLHDLLETPLDPLALFGAPDRAMSSSGWDGASWNETAAAGLFADLVPAPAHDGFKTPRPDSLPGHAIRDDGPEFGGHLRLRIAVPTDKSETPEPLGPLMSPGPLKPLDTLEPPAPPPRTVPEHSAIEAAASPVLESSSTHDYPNGQADYRDAFGETNRALACVVRTPVPDYSGKLQRKTALQNDGPIKLREPFAPPISPASPFPPRVEPSALHAALIQPFLEGAGVTPDAVNEAGLTPALMYTLGTLVRALKGQVT